jgi:antitoxin CptB
MGDPRIDRFPARPENRPGQVVIGLDKTAAPGPFTGIVQLRRRRAMSEDRETRIKRLRLRSWRRGTKEMDLILGSFADKQMHLLSDADLDAHEAIMAENDQDLYRWISGQVEMPDEIRPALERVADHFSKQKAE